MLGCSAWSRAWCRGRLYSALPLESWRKDRTTFAAGAGKAATQAETWGDWDVDIDATTFTQPRTKKRLDGTVERELQPSKPSRTQPTQTTPWGDVDVWDEPASERRKPQQERGKGRGRGSGGRRGSDYSRGDGPRREANAYTARTSSSTQFSGRPRESEAERRDREELWEEQRKRQGEIVNAREALRGDTVLYGVVPLLTALKATRRRIHAVYVQEGMDMGKRKDSGAVAIVQSRAREADLPVRTLSKHIMNELAGQRPHQGLIADCDELPYDRMDVLPTAEEVMQAQCGGPPPVWLAMDQVFDPQNLGAMLRSAYYVGAGGVLASAKNCAPLSPAASKASAGCLEVMTVFDSNNLARTLVQAAADGWAVLGADAGNSAVNCSEVRVTRPTILVMGNEGYGLRTNVRRACSGLVRIEAATSVDTSVVDSLNVSVATGILLHQLVGTARMSAG